MLQAARDPRLVESAGENATKPGREKGAHDKEREVDEVRPAGEVAQPDDHENPDPEEQPGDPSCQVEDPRFPIAVPGEQEGKFLQQSDGEARAEVAEEPLGAERRRNEPGEDTGEQGNASSSMSNP
jgi:hypothetical protein